MKEKILIMILFYLPMLEISVIHGPLDIISSNIKFTMTLLNNGSSMKRLVPSIIMQPLIISSQMIMENSKLVKLLLQKLENGSGMELRDNWKLKLEITLTLLVHLIHQNQTSILKLELIA